jgi:hypothetical protein
VPKDIVERGQSYNLSQGGDGLRVRILSALDLKRQIGSDGATWLDRELASSNRTELANAGFGREVSEAMERRRQSLVDQGHAVRLDDGRIRAPKDLIANLERSEVNRLGQEMAAARGRAFTTAKPGEYVNGTLVGSTNLASGRFAMIDDGIGFQQHGGKIVRLVNSSLTRNSGTCRRRAPRPPLPPATDRPSSGRQVHKH